MPAAAPKTLSDLVREKLDARTKQVDVPGWHPQPKQETARKLSRVVSELLYGGAAGGGKSFFIRADAVDFALNHAGAHIGIVRRVLPMLKQSHLAGMMALTHSLAVHNRTESTWTFPNGSVIRFIGLQYDGDEQNYKSVEFDRLYFDEVTEFLETQYTYMLTRLRSTFSGFCVPCGQRGHKTAAIACSNPEGVGFAWVRRRFVTPKADDLAPGQPPPVPLQPWAPPLSTGEPGPSRVYVPASVYDNQALLAANPDYLLKLKAIPDPRKREALLNGDWNAMDHVPGAYFTVSQIDEHRIRTDQDPATLFDKLDIFKVWVAIDPAGTSGPYSDETGIIAGGLNRKGHTYILGDRSGKYGAAEWAREALNLYIDMQADYLVVESNAGAGKDSLIRNIKIEAAAMIRERALTHEPTIIDVTATRGKAVRAQPVAGLYNQGVVHHVGTYKDLEEQMTTWVPTSSDSPDRLDALVWGITSTMPGTKPVKKRRMAYKGR